MGIPLDFSPFCQKCGSCCTGVQEGSILMFPLDVHALAKYFTIDWKQIVGKYCKEIEYEHLITDEEFQPTGRKVYLPVYALNMSQRDDCPFFEQERKGCAIYPARPFQCRQYPFLECVLTDRDQIAEIKHLCAGFCNWIHEKSPDWEQIISDILLNERILEHKYYIALKTYGNHLSKAYSSFRMK